MKVQEEEVKRWWESSKKASIRKCKPIKTTSSSKQSNQDAMVTRWWRLMYAVTLQWYIFPTHPFLLMQQQTIHQYTIVLLLHDAFKYYFIFIVWLVKRSFIESDESCWWYCRSSNWRAQRFFTAVGCVWDVWGLLERYELVWGKDEQGWWLVDEECTITGWMSFFPCSSNCVAVRGIRVLRFPLRVLVGGVNCHYSNVMPDSKWECWTFARISFCSSDCDLNAGLSPNSVQIHGINCQMPVGDNLSLKGFESVFVYRKTRQRRSALQKECEWIGEKLESLLRQWVLEIVFCSQIVYFSCPADFYLLEKVLMWGSWTPSRMQIAEMSFTCFQQCVKAPCCDL